MDKASKVLRRSSVRIRSIGSGHGELNLAISELKEMRVAAKAFLTAQLSASSELLQWAQAGENRAIQDTFIFLNELNTLWSETQKDFAEHLKDFKTQFDLILEGEKHVDQARTAVELCDQRESKLRKEMKKARKFSALEMEDLEKRLCEAARAKEIAQLEVDDRVRENEAVKMIRVKRSLLKLSDTYVELANKCKVIFEAYGDVVQQLPDVEGEDLQNIRYTGYEASKQAITRAKEGVNQYRRSSSNYAACAPQAEDPPPPYSICPPYNPSFEPGQHSHYVRPSTSYDVTDGGSSGQRRNSNALRNSISSSAVSSSSDPRALAATSSNSNNRPRRRGFFFRRSFRRSDSSVNRNQQRQPENARPRSMPGPSRSSNPFDSVDESEENHVSSTQRAGSNISSPSSVENVAGTLSQTRLS
ncbi:Staphylocoagulase [Frankliniella fusca]|uniref:Staphylocoagulase n=1 Tax=Frankliniella fusca TaxID=407009 RepID=A0AAE1I3F5_9NEOP|nr:Staphylocoagulase [Frankliniella fusca]